MLFYSLFRKSFSRTRVIGTVLVDGGTPVRAGNVPASLSFLTTQKVLPLVDFCGQIPAGILRFRQGQSVTSRRLADASAAARKNAENPP
jgi:hypothetical protein